MERQGDFSVEKRSFILGLGIGIIVSVIIIWSVYKISGIGNDDITNLEIERRARELGMEYFSENVSEESSEISSEVITYAPAVYEAETSVAETYGNKEELPQIENSVNDDSEKKNTSNNVLPNKKVSENKRTENDKNKKEVFNGIDGNPEKEDMSNAEGTFDGKENSPIEQTGESLVDVTITAGTNARRVSNIFAEKGIIENAAEYEKFLIDNKKTKSIRTGNYKIPKNIGYEELTKIIIEKPKR